MENNAKQNQQIDSLTAVSEKSKSGLTKTTFRMCPKCRDKSNRFGNPRSSCRGAPRARGGGGRRCQQHQQQQIRQQTERPFFYLNNDDKKTSKPAKKAYNGKEVDESEAAAVALEQVRISQEPSDPIDPNHRQHCQQRQAEPVGEYYIDNYPGLYEQWHDNDEEEEFDEYYCCHDEEDEDNDNRDKVKHRVLVGICAMAKKSQSKPMKEILSRLNEFEYIDTIVFEESMILEQPVHEWPVVDCLISFHSKGFPLAKAIEYAAQREPFVINDLHMQYDIQDRRKVYKTIEEAGIELPRYVVLDRDSPNPEDGILIECEDSIEVNGVVFNKPFVEKPISAEDHNIYIYYPSSAGGGSQRLFRKIGSRSSVYSNESQVRKSGSFIYEEFMPTDGTDVKVYTVGPDYAHAEARKSPALDGKVERDKDGKEVRYPVMLSNAEKLIARKVCLAFKQTVCGFDLLRANGKSYVCDVNGFSFVKNSMKYYDDAARLLGNMILRIMAPQLHIPWSIPFQLDDPPIMPTTFGKMMELRCVVAVIRHGDRTPKQKMKMEVRHPKFFEIFENYGGFKENNQQHHVKLKQPKQLQEILDVARYLCSEIDQNHDNPEIEENRSKLEQLKSVLEMYGHFSGINRKVQLKYQPKGRPRRSSSEEDLPREPSLLCIVKWGGELTPRGRIQAEEMGRMFRCMYPGGQGDYSGNQGLGLLRLHSTFRHDLKIYASDEGRVQMTAAAFAKGLLALEGELTPILVQMVKSANTNGLLDNDCDSSKFQNMVKHKIHELMQLDRDFTEEDAKKLNPLKAPSITNAINFVKNPVKACDLIHNYIKKLNNLIKERRNESHLQDAHLYYGETWDLMQRRWSKLEKDFKLKSGKYDISKIPDIFDCIKYDLQHNQHILQSSDANDFYTYAKALADIVIPQEYGTTAYEKLTIGLGTCTPLLKKIKADLLSIITGTNGDTMDGVNDLNESVNRLNPQYSYGVSSPGRHVRTRLYFTSESHIHSLLNVIRLGGLFDETKDEQWKRAMDYISVITELNYLTQIVIMLYEDQTKDQDSDDRFHVELHFSPGVVCCLNQKNLPKGPGFRTQTGSRSTQTKKVVVSTSLPSSIKEEDEEYSMSSDDDENDDYNREEKDNPNVHHVQEPCTPTGTEPILIPNNDKGRKKSSRNHTSFTSNPPPPLVDSTTDTHNSALNVKNNAHSTTTMAIPFTSITTSTCHSIMKATTKDAAASSSRLHRYSHHHHISFARTTSDHSATPIPLATTSISSSNLFNSSTSTNPPGHCKKRLIHSQQAIESPVIPEEPESPPETKALDQTITVKTTISSLAFNKDLIPKSQPIPITISTCHDRKSPSGELPQMSPGKIHPRSNSICTERAHSLETDKPDKNLEMIIQNAQLHNTGSGTTNNQQTSPQKKAPPMDKDNSITLSWNDVSTAGCSMSSSQQQKTMATCTRKGYRNSIPIQLMRLYIPENQQQTFGSTSTLFSTAVISGSSSTPNLQDITLCLEATPGLPTIRPLETLHNALSLKHLNSFLDKMILSPWYRFPGSPSKSPVPVLYPMPSIEQCDLLVMNEETITTITLPVPTTTKLEQESSTIEKQKDNFDAQPD